MDSDEPKNKLLLFDPDVFRGANERDRRQVIEKIGILIEKPANEIDYEFLNADLGFEVSCYCTLSSLLLL